MPIRQTSNSWSTRLSVLLYLTWLLLCVACESFIAVAYENMDSGSGETDSATSTSTSLNDSETSDTGAGTATESATGEDNSDASDCNLGIPLSGTRVLDVDGVTRTYVLHVPPAYNGDVPAPVIVDFHAIAHNGMMQREYSIYPEYTDSEGVIMAFPDGEDGPKGAAWNIGPCCVNDLDRVDDVAFARAVVADIEAVACIDPKRVYAAGAVMGGGMANRLACEAADVFAAVVSSSFDLISETVDDCMPARPVTTIAFRGALDSFIPYDGGSPGYVDGQSVEFLGAVDSFEKWAEINGCTGTPIDDENGCLRYAGSQCEQDAEVVLCVEENGGTTLGDGDMAWMYLKRQVLQ